MNKIPKVIHYCWFGKNKLSKSAKKCIKSWKKHLPNYEIIEWNENNFDINCNEYVREAYKSKKYAFVSDYARIYALYNYGGIYMDTDVEVIKSLDKFLCNDAFAGLENEYSIQTAVMGCCKGNLLFKEFLILPPKFWLLSEYILKGINIITSHTITFTTQVKYLKRRR